jgi:hypothetical protein
MRDRNPAKPTLLLAALCLADASAQNQPPPPPPSITINDVTQQFESDSGSGVMSFTVSMASPVGQNVVLIFSTSDVTARGGASCGGGTDYLRQQQVGLTIFANQTSATLAVPFCGDTVDEEAETFNVLLSMSAAPAGVTISDGTAVGTIVDDDNSPPVRIAAAPVAEGNAGTTSLAFTLTRDGLSERQVQVGYATSGAAAGATPAATQGSSCGGATDFIGASGTVTFSPGGPAGATQTVGVQVCGDTTLENNENVRLTLSGPVNATLPAATASGTILNDEPPQATVADVSVIEGTPPANAGINAADHTTWARPQVRLSQPTTLPVSVNLQTQNGTAVGRSTPCGKPLAIGTLPGDFSSRSSVVSIPAGTTTVSVDVGVCKDTRAEPDENLTVTLSNPVNATLGGQSSAVITIRNDD